MTLWQFLLLDRGSSKRQYASHNALTLASQMSHIVQKGPQKVNYDKLSYTFLAFNNNCTHNKKDVGHLKPLLGTLVGN
jgi:hypothetical protein